MEFPVFDLPWWGMVLLALLTTHITIISVTLYLHRHQAHRSIELNPVLSHFFRLWLWLYTGMVTWEWVAIHRKHHANVETDEDPHSPQVHGIKYFFKLMLPPALTGGVKLYREASEKTDELQQYRHGTPDDWIERHIYSAAPNVGIIILLFIDLALFGIAGVFIWLVQIMWIPFWAAGVINGIGHYSGYRNYETPDASRNIVPWGIIVGGEELHNNHHAYASSAKFSIRPFEFDIGWVYIRLLSFLKLAKVKKVAPSFKTSTVKELCDIETVKTLFSNRVQVMANFTQEVLRQVCKDESGKLKTRSKDQEFKALKKAHLLMCKEWASLDDSARKKLQSILNNNQNLQFVYQMKIKLQEIIASNQKANHQNALSHLQAWCKKAEESGIAALAQFSMNLKRYSLSEAPG